MVLAADNNMQMEFFMTFGPSTFGEMTFGQVKARKRCIRACHAYAPVGGLNQWAYVVYWT